MSKFCGAQVPPPPGSLWDGASGCYMAQRAAREDHLYSVTEPWMEKTSVPAHSELSRSTCQANIALPGTVQSSLLRVSHYHQCPDIRIYLEFSTIGNSGGKVFIKTGKHRNIA
jgi:hypothetical protein